MKFVSFFFLVQTTRREHREREQVRNEVQQVWAPINKLRCVIYGRLVAIMTGRNKKLGLLLYIIIIEGLCAAATTSPASVFDYGRRKKEKKKSADRKRAEGVVFRSAATPRVMSCVRVDV